MSTDDTINCLEDAINLVRWKSGRLADLNAHIVGYDDEFPRGTWFRGQEDASWHLVPSVFRRSDQGELMYARKEPDILRDFKLRQANRNPAMLDTLDWLCLMQNHNCPTRILDWTENVLVALFFGVRQSRESDDKDGALFVLNSIKLNYHTAGRPRRLRAGDLPAWVRAQLAEDTSFESLLSEIENERPADLRQFRAQVRTDRHKLAAHLSRPVAVWPRSIHERMVRQQSVFVVHGGTFALEANGIPDPVLLEELDRKLDDGLKFLRKFRIPATAKEPIRNDLRSLGIHIASLFPELEYQADFIKNAWTAKISKRG